MTAPAPTELAQALADAWRQGRPIDAAAWSGALADDAAAYAVQDALVRALDGPAGASASRCWKSGGPGRDRPLTHAPLPAPFVRPSPADDTDLPLRRRGIEAEIALRLGRDVTPAAAASLRPGEAASVVDAMAVSIEIVDSRWAQGPQADARLRLADLQSHGALVLGDWVRFEPRDWSKQACEVRIGAAAAHVGVGTQSLGDPAWGLAAWLQHATRHGETVPAGTVVTTGTWCGLLDAAAGDRVEVAFPGIGHASVQL